MKICKSKVFEAAQECGIGTLVGDWPAFTGVLRGALHGFKFPESGQATVEVPGALPLVQCGVASRQSVGFHDCNVRMWRGRLQVFAQRKLAAKPEYVYAVVYTAAAAQVAGEDPLGADVVVVSVLATVEVDPPVDSVRFVRNLAGENARYATYTFEQVVAEATRVADYESRWMTVG